MNSKFTCTECNRTTEKFIATIEGPEGIFDGILEYCHFCDLGFYQSHSDHIELVYIEKTKVNDSLEYPYSENISMPSS
jgi:hypothetical protein